MPTFVKAYTKMSGKRVRAHTRFDRLVRLENRVRKGLMKPNITERHEATLTRRLRGATMGILNARRKKGGMHPVRYAY